MCRPRPIAPQPSVAGTRRVPRSEATAPQPPVAGTRRVPSALTKVASPLSRRTHLPPLAVMRCVTPSKRRLVQPQLRRSCMGTRPRSSQPRLVVIGRDHDVEPFPRQYRRFRTRSTRESSNLDGKKYLRSGSILRGSFKHLRAFTLAALHGVQLSRGDPPSGHGEQLGRFLVEVAKDTAGTYRGSSSPSRRPDPRSRSARRAGLPPP